MRPPEEINLGRFNNSLNFAVGLQYDEVENPNWDPLNNPYITFDGYEFHNPESEAGKIMITDRY